ncbi:hypothetical protein D3C72_1611440 [compost metagenome]
MAWAIGVGQAHLAVQGLGHGFIDAAQIALELGQLIRRQRAKRCVVDALDDVGHLHRSAHAFFGEPQAHHAAVIGAAFAFDDAFFHQAIHQPRHGSRCLHGAARQIGGGLRLAARQTQNGNPLRLGQTQRLHAAVHFGAHHRRDDAHQPAREIGGLDRLDRRTARRQRIAVAVIRAVVLHARIGHAQTSFI